MLNYVKKERNYYEEEMKKERKAKEDLQHQLELKKDIISKLEEKVDAASKQIAVLEEKLSTQSASSSAIENSNTQIVDQLQQDNDKLSKELNAKDLTIQEITNNYNAKQNELTLLAETLEQLKIISKEANAKAIEDVNSV